MDRKQKQKLRFYIKARKRAEKVLAERREAEQKKLDHKKRLQASRELKEQFSQELTALALRSGILSLCQQAADARGGSLMQEVSCYVDYGLSSTYLHQAVLDETRGELRPSHLSLRITWGDVHPLKEVEVRVHANGNITFHNSPVPVYPFVWRVLPRLLNVMLESALNHPRPLEEPEETQP